MSLDVAGHLRAEGFRDARVLAAMMRVDRAAFVPVALRRYANADEALPIGHRQTISQPYIVAVMTSALRIKPGDRVLEIGTGSGYQAAVLAELGCEVYSIERIQELAEGAARALASGGYRVHLRVGDGTAGWPAQGPFDGIIVTAATATVPPELLRQLKVDGRMVIPIGTDDQRLHAITRRSQGFESEMLLPVRFVPLVSE